MKLTMQQRGMIVVGVFFLILTCIAGYQDGLKGALCFIGVMATMAALVLSAAWFIEGGDDE